MEERIIEVGKQYKHFKGHLYEVTAIAYDSEKFDQDNIEESKMVVYKNIENGDVWVRPYKMFNSLVDKNKYPMVQQKYRFEEVEKRN